MSAAGRRSRGPTRFKGIGADARALGVSRTWLTAVLSGRGTSAPLLARYRALKSTSVAPEAAAPASP